MATLIDYYNTGDDGADVLSTATEWLAQIFKASSGYKIATVKLLFYRSGSPGNITVSIRATEEDGIIAGRYRPTGADLVSKVISGTSFADETKMWVTFTFATPYQLTSGTRYAIVLRIADDGGGVMQWYQDGSSPTYTDGNRSRSTNSGSTWASLTTLDFMFETYSFLNPPSDILTYKRLVAAGNNEIWYEDLDTAAGVMTELTDANGDIDTTDQLNMFEAYQKVFLVNGANLKVADFINTKITVSALTTPPVKGEILTQDQGGGAIAYMVVDFVNTAKTLIYGYAYYAGSATAFNTTVDISSSGSTMDPDPIPNANISAVTASPHWYDWTVYPDGSSGTMPNNAYIGCLYRGRCVISGNPEKPFQWYMSRQGDPWDFAYVANDAGSPVAGGNADAGEIGDIVRALIPYKDDYLIFGCATQMWFMAGDPAEGGSLNELDLTVGIFGANSWCFDGLGTFFFWGTNGIYSTSIPGTPKCLSEINLPKLIGDEAADPSTHRVTLAYDRTKTGVLICVTKLSDGSNSNYFYDLRSGGFFPETYPDECGAYSLFYYAANDTTLKDLLIGCTDGYIRKFDDSAKSDDIGGSDQAIDSYITFGPIPMAGDPRLKGKLTRLDCITAGGASNGSQSDSDDITYDVFVGNSAEQVIEKLSADTNPSIAGIIKAPGRQRGGTKRGKIAGVYMGVKLQNDTIAETWGFEQLLIDLKDSGRVK